MEENFLKNLNDDQLVSLYSIWIKELKDRKIIRTNNVVGDLGEHIAIQYYNKTRGLPKLKIAPVSTTDYDAVGRDGELYAIKTITTTTTSSFFGVTTIDNKIFDKLIIVKLNKEDYTVDRIIEMDWEAFFNHKHWHSRMNTYNILLSNKILKDSKIVYDAKK